MTPLDSNGLYTQLGQRIRNAREKVGMSQEVLAEQLSLTRASIVNIENGKQRPMLHTLLSICDILKTNLKVLLPEYVSENEESEMALVAAAAPPVVDTIITQNDEAVDEDTKDAILKFVAHLKK
ncbi:helix-turn-helix transcriptional regulator [Chitinophaga sp. LS1]|uniref:helix-turn-helix domain-containing protein n=1 Tax=Chitinophaga sp. LS1 TaxID=3051176 RepID=UPI002AAB7D76|nr:helix-turn-helix transcriptional regulator [Chitinophaga sp. LS1]WPV67511.1 helix-turn-helix transcriptional regulator [Chitinophaga sp. LS1]